MSSRNTVKKTNAMRILDNAGIPYTVLTYDDDTEHPLESGAALRTAEKLGLSPETVFKTIVMRSDTKEICVFCVPAPQEVNLKKARSTAGVKELSPVKPAEINSLTGYIRGGCSPLGMKRQYRTFIDSSAGVFPVIYISAGQRGVQIGVPAEALAGVTGAVFADIAG